MDKIQRKTDWVDHLLGVLAFIFIFFCVLVVKEAKAHHDAKEPIALPTWQAPAIEQCDLPLWDRIRFECPDDN